MKKILQQSNINIKYLEVINEVQYPQMNNNKFIDNLSIIDVIANTGLAGTLEYLYKKYKLI